MDKSRQLFKKASKTFYNSTKFFPEDIRDEVTILYAFVRTADDFVDSTPQDKDEFYKFKEDYYKALDGSSVDNQIINRFVKLSKRRKFERQWTDAFLQSMESDLKGNKYQDERDTLTYIFGSASVIGLYMAKILKLPRVSYKYAAGMGNAFQYINFIRDVKEDLAMNRNYFPKEDINKYRLKEYSYDYLKNNPEKFTRFLKYQMRKYKCWLEDSKVGLKYIPKRFRIAIKTAIDLYNWTGEVIDNDPMIVLEKKVKPGKLRIYLTGIKNILIA